MHTFDGVQIAEVTVQDLSDMAESAMLTIGARAAASGTTCVVDIACSTNESQFLQFYIVYVWIVVYVCVLRCITSVTNVV